MISRVVEYSDGKFVGQVLRVFVFVPFWWPMNDGAMLPPDGPGYTIHRRDTREAAEMDIADWWDDNHPEKNRIVKRYRGEFKP